MKRGGAEKPAAPEEANGKTPGETYAHPRRWEVLSKSEGETMVQLLDKAGFKIYKYDYEGFSVVRVRYGEKFVVDQLK